MQKWDQSDNHRGIEQSPYGSEPEIFLGGVLVKENVNAQTKRNPPKNKSDEDHHNH